MSEQKTNLKAPNVVLWSWMRTVTQLIGNELFVFAYIFSQTFDSVHKCWTCLSEMENWFGITRQTVSRNIESLIQKNLVIKECHKDIENSVIKHNCYYVNTEYITKLCEDSSYDNYQNFLDSYRQILKQKFPDDTRTIDEYLDQLSSWHENKDIKVCITLNELAQLLYKAGNDVDLENEETEQKQTEKQEPVSIIDTLKVIRKENKQIKRSPQKDYISKSTLIEKDQLVKANEVTNKLFDKPKKRKSRKAEKEEWDRVKREMSSSFVLFNGSGSEILSKLLNDFLDTDNGKSYTPTQWEHQLDNLQKYGRTLDRMIEGVRNSFMNNYRSLYIVDKNEVDIDLKLAEIDSYMEKDGENNEELKDYLVSYVVETPKGKSFTLKQFMLKLSDLSRLCPTIEQKIASVKASYMCSYASLAYESNTNTAQQKVSDIDMDAKHEIINKFIQNGCYYLNPDIEKYLTMYLDEVESIRAMKASSFELLLDNFRLYCLDDADKIAKLKVAIQNNSSKLAMEDFAESNRIKSKFETREGLAKSGDNYRKTQFVKEKRMNPNNPLIKDIPMPKFN